MVDEILDNPVFVRLREHFELRRPQGGGRSDLRETAIEASHGREYPISVTPSARRLEAALGEILITGVSDHGQPF
jgi:hypothetical protein